MCSACCWVLREHAVRFDRVFVSWVNHSARLATNSRPVGRKVFAVVVLVFWWLFENCTVDASIFVVKFLRAHGGCLGIRSR